MHSSLLVAILLILVKTLQDIKYLTYFSLSFLSYHIFISLSLYSINVSDSISLLLFCSVHIASFSVPSAKLGPHHSCSRHNRVPVMKKKVGALHTRNTQNRHNAHMSQALNINVNFFRITTCSFQKPFGSWLT